jgi:hypothetical protein
MTGLCAVRGETDLFLTGASCHPDSPTHLNNLSNSEVAVIMSPYLEGPDFVTALPGGDRFFRVNPDLLCGGELVQ